MPGWHCKPSRWHLQKKNLSNRKPMLSAWLDTEGECESCFKRSHAERSLLGRNQHFLNQTLSAFFYSFYNRIISTHHQFSLPMYGLNMLPFPSPPIYQLKISPAASVLLFFTACNLHTLVFIGKYLENTKNALCATSFLLLLEDLLSL